MHKTAYLTIFLLVLVSCNPVSRLYVTYGDEEKLRRADQQAIRLYFDKVGYLYPQADINDIALRAEGSELRWLYEKDPQLYARVCAQYGIKPGDANAGSRHAYQEPLQQAIIDELAKKINAATTTAVPVLIIHGFNEHPVKPNAQKNCFAENRATAENLKRLRPDQRFTFIEVYWDGLAAQNGSKLALFNSPKIWGDAQVNATYAGLELRRILSQLNAPDLYVVTHSHGAAVITTALFNVIKFDSAAYEKPGHWLHDVKYRRYENKLYNTPTQRYHVGMLAPAIPGENVFAEYWDRTRNGKNETDSSLNNYRFIVGFNANDPVTSKGKLLASKFGSTTLASRRNELKTTMDIFGDRPLMDYVDFSRFNSGKRQIKHGWFVYMDNEPYFSRFVQKLFSNTGN